MSLTPKLSGKSKSSSSSKTKKDDKSAKDEYSSEFLRQKLRDSFKHSDFKSTLQKEAIKEILKGSRDVYVSMPTGSGKSLCYQLPGILYENKITIVFSPLIALIKDQMDHLTKLKISAESLNSKMTVKERERVILDLKSIKPSTKFLYITPEQAATPFFRNLLDHIVKFNKLALVAVDECHCVSEMGHQFRKDYLKLGELRQRYPTIKWIALTATASKDVTDDVFKQLHLKEPKSFKTPCFRRNLFYDIIYKNSIQDDFIHLKEFAARCLKSKTGDGKPNNAPCGIIYCRTRESVERVAIGLSKQGIATRPYHAGLNDKDRKQTQEDWMDGRFPVISATNSFGMGVDKATVRFVVHWDVPQNIAAYYQESGRAGRDGEKSFCRLYYDRQEVKSISFLLNQQLSKTPDCVKAKRSVKEFDKLVEHCESLHCRHLLFSKYFGDQAPDCKKKALCDVCKEPKIADKKLEMFHKLMSSSFASRMEVALDSSDLYEGGRNAVHEAEASYGNDDDDYSESSASARDSRARKETTNLIQKEFERRKQKIEAAKKLELTQTRASGIRIISSTHTSKIAGVDTKKRESYLDYLLKVLRENAEKATEKPTHSLKSCDFEDIAAQLEYNCFTKNRVLAMYTKSITVERLRIDRSTKNNELLPEIKNHIPKKRTAHGGSAAAMQKDLDDFMKQNNLNGDTNTVANQSSSSVSHTHTNVGFQTARQINNKLKEPNRMKKDPLTQTSMNSFLKASSIKREPDDNGYDAEQSAQHSKRRKVDGEQQAQQVVVKSEPMDTECDTQPNTQPNINVKNEPEDYDDSDANTEAGSDDEDTQMGTATEIPSNQNPPPISTNRVKMEQNSDVDTDEASDEEETFNPTAMNSARSNGHEPPKQPQVNKQVNNERKTGASQSRTERDSVEQRRIKTEPVTTHESTSTMVVSEPTAFERNIKGEPADEIKSDEETDEENNGGDVEMEEEQEEPRIKTEVQDNSYDRYYNNQNNFEKFEQQQKEMLRRQQASTSNSIYDSYPSTSNTPNLPVAPSAEMYYRRDDKKQPLNVVGTRSSKQAADGTQVLRFNQFEPSANDDSPQEAEFNYDDDFTDMTEDLMMFVKDYESQIVEELAELKQTDLNTLSSVELREYTERLEQLTRKKQAIMKQKAEESSRESKVKKDLIRDDFLRKLFRPDFDVSAWERRLGIVAPSAQPVQPSRSRGPSHSPAPDQKDRKLATSYNDFMKKPIKLENSNPLKESHYNMAVNDYVKKMHQSDMIDLVPKKVIDTVKGDKTIIMKKVEQFLKPYYERKVISKPEYEAICKTVTTHHYETNDYDMESIENRVEKFVSAVRENRKK